MPVEPSPAPQVALDGHMRVLDFNAAAETLLGYHRYEMVGRPLSALLPEGLGVVSLSRLQEAVARGQVGDIEKRKALNLRHGQGYELPVQACLSLTRDPDLGYAVIATLQELDPEQEAQLHQEVLTRVTTHLEQGTTWEALAALMHAELEQVLSLDWLTLGLIKPRCGSTRVLSWSGTEGAAYLESGQTMELNDWMEDLLALGESRVCRLGAGTPKGLELTLLEAGLRELLFVPLHNGRRSLGLLALACHEHGTLTRAHQVLVEQMVGPLVGALERELAKGQAQVYRRRYHEMLAHMEGPVFALDLEGRLQYGNPALVRLLACSDLAELKLVTPDLFQVEGEQRRELLGELLDRGWLDQRRFELVDCGGRHHALSFSAHLVYDEVGKPLAIEGSLHELHGPGSGPAAPRSTSDGAPGRDPAGEDPVLMADEQGLICQANQPAARLFDTTPDRLVGRLISEVVGSLQLPGHPFDGPPFEVPGPRPLTAPSPPAPIDEPAGEAAREVAEAAAGTLPAPSSARVVTGGGTPRSLDLTRSPATPVPPDSHQEPISSIQERMRGYASKLAHDIELDHQLEQKEELEGLKVRMSELSQDLDRLLGPERGEVTPPADQAVKIADLASQVDWLLERMAPFPELAATAADLTQLRTQLEQRLEELAGTVASDQPPLKPEEGGAGLASALSEAVNGSSPLALPERDLAPMVLAPLDMNHLLESTLTSLNDPLRARATVLFKAGELPPVLAQADQIGQVLTNLLLNAAQSIPDHGTISVASRSQEGWVIVDISDDGEGMTQEELDRIFEPFYTTRPEGQGLGLPLAQRIVTSHQGLLKVTSRKDAGSTFSLWLPTLKGQERGDPGGQGRSGAGEDEGPMTGNLFDHT